MIVVCEYCGTEVKRKKSHAEKKSRKFCSKECHCKYMRQETIKKWSKQADVDDLKAWFENMYLNEKKTVRQIMKLLDTKSASLVMNLLDHFNIEKRYGSEAIKTQWINNDERRKQNAENIKKTLHSKEAREKLKNTMKTEGYKKKTSDAKLGDKNPMYGVVGEENPKWNPDRTHEQRVKERKTTKDSVWRNEVFTRDNHICQCCGYSKGGIIVSHHLDSYDIHKNSRYDVDNGITLCEKCHKTFHSLYGYGKNSKEQFNKYLALIAM